MLCLLVLPLVFVARWICWAQLHCRCFCWPSCFVACVCLSTGFAAVFVWPAGFAILFSVPLVLPHVFLLARPLVLPLALGNIEQRIILPKALSVTPPASYYILASVIALYSIYNIGLKGSVTARGMDKHATLSSEVHALPSLVVAFLVLGAMRVRCWCLRTYDVGTMLLGLSGTIVGLS